MGDCADMLLEGLLDEETGEYIGHYNKKYFGEEAPGFPVSYVKHRQNTKNTNLTNDKNKIDQDSNKYRTSDKSQKRVK